MPKIDKSGYILQKKNFVELAHHSSSQAHFREVFFSWEGSGAGREFYPDLSSERTHPKPVFRNDHRYIQGIFMYVTESVSDLYLICSYYAEIGEPYYVFFNVENKEEENSNDSGWVIWLPERK